MEEDCTYEQNQESLPGAMFDQVFIHLFWHKIMIGQLTMESPQERYNIQKLLFCMYFF